MPDLWPAEFGTIGVTPPIVTLREQAEIIGKKTGGSIVGQVETGKEDPSGFFHNFFLVAPLLDNYTYRLFMVIHPLQMYPLVIYADVLNQRLTCNSPEEFLNQLKTILSSEETKKVVASLLEQTEAVKA